MSIVRVESVSVLVNGSTNIYPTSLSITCGIGKGYNSFTMSGYNLQVSTSDLISININGQVFSFLVDKVEYNRQDQVSISGYSLTYRLDDGIPSDTEYAYSNSYDLLIDCMDGIEYEYNIPLIVFEGQTYAKTSTRLSRVLDMVKVVGGDVYEHNGVLFLDEKKAIPQDATPVHSFIDGEYFDYSYSNARQSSLLVKQVLFNPILDDIYAETSINFEFDDNVGKGEIFFNPSLSTSLPVTIQGIYYREPTYSNKVESISIDNQMSITTLGGIDSVDYITLNGEPLLNYIVYSPYNVVRFEEQLTGELEISYKTKTITAYAYTDSYFSIYYECSECSGLLEIGSDNVIDSGRCYGEIVSPLTYENGGTVYVSSGIDVTFVFVERKGAINLVQYGTMTLASGGTLTIKYIYDIDDWDDVDFMGNITSEVVEKIETTSSNVVFDDDLQKYVLYLDKPIESINDIYFGSVLLTADLYEYVPDQIVPYIEFVDNKYENKTLDVSMNVKFDMITIPAPLADHPVSILDVVTCDGVASEDFVPDDTVMCNLPATFKINVADIFGVDISSVFGAELNGDFGTLTVDNFGNIEVTVDEAKLYTIDASSIKENGTITVDANGVI